MMSIDWLGLCIVSLAFGLLYSFLWEIDEWAALALAGVSVLLLCTYLAEVSV